MRYQLFSSKAFLLCWGMVGSIRSIAQEEFAGNGDDNPWNVRSEMWKRRVVKQTVGRAKRERQRHPLILSGHGVSLRIEGGALTIRSGFTHYPQSRKSIGSSRANSQFPNALLCSMEAGASHSTSSLGFPSSRFL
jgi:hypothetical protein